MPGVPAPFPLGPLPFPGAVPVPLPAPAFVPVLDPLSSGVVGTAAAAAAAAPAPGPPPLETEARRVGAGTSSFCATTFDVVAVLVVVEPPLGPWTVCGA